jgi:hypothetical protein
MDPAEQGLMTYFEAEAHSFVLRIWRENRNSTQDRGEWRGWIEHVQSKQRYYFRDLFEIPHIINAYAGDAVEVSDQVFMPIQAKGASKK